jgi:hypothetical protein
MSGAAPSLSSLLASPEGASDSEAYWRRVYSEHAVSPLTRGAPMLVGKAAALEAGSWRAAALELLLTHRLALFGASQGDGSCGEARRDEGFCR